MNVKVNDLRTDYGPTFKEIKVGDIFTEPANDYTYIKMRPCHCEKNDTTFNAICLDGDTSWFDDDEIVAPVKEIEITIR